MYSAHRLYLPLENINNEDGLEQTETCSYARVLMIVCYCCDSTEYKLFILKMINAMCPFLASFLICSIINYYTQPPNEQMETTCMSTLRKLSVSDKKLFIDF